MQLVLAGDWERNTSGICWNYVPGVSDLCLVYSPFLTREGTSGGQEPGLSDPRLHLSPWAHAWIRASIQ